METKTSKIKKSVFSNEWPKDDILLYIFDLELENGDTGAIFVNSMESPKAKKGTEITYTLEKNKFKVKDFREAGAPPRSASASGTQNNNSYTRYNRGSNKTDYAGISWSYAKDLLIAGKTSKDLEELNKMARFIYNEIGKMITNEQQ